MLSILNTAWHLQSHRPLGIPGLTPPKKVDQTYTSDKNGFGNCLQAAVATLFDLPLDDVVDLRPKPFSTAPSQSLRLENWLRERGWAVSRWPGDRSYTGYYIASGLVRRSIYIPHAVVMHDGALYHDPHPSREGLCFQKSALLFYPIR